jgi:septum site-determining protein MinC
LSGNHRESKGLSSNPQSHAEGRNNNQRSASPMPLRGASYTMMVLSLTELAQPDFFPRLQAKISQAPSFFDGAPILLNLEGTSGGSASDFKELVARLRELRLALVGVQGGDDAQHEAAMDVGLAIFPSWRAGSRGLRDLAMPVSGSSSAPEPVVEVKRPLLIERPVRSGTRIYAEGTDLVVTAPVGAGSELLADGSIHVYAPLRGRALAGVSGDTDARIFCRHLAAELLSIAGRHLVNEEIADAVLGQPVHVRLEGDQLLIETVD